jgi:hypothetical protein
MLFLTILGTAIATAGAGQAAAWVKDRWMAGQEGKFSTLYAALFFEDYADACSRRLGEREAYISSGGHAGTEHSALPDLADFPKEIDWHRVGIRMTEEAFAFRVKLSAAHARIADLYDFDPPDGGDGELLRELTIKGLEALALGRRLRAAGRLKPAPIPNPDYSTERYLTERRDHWTGIQEKRLAAQKASNLALGATLAAPTAAPTNVLDATPSIS